MAGVFLRFINVNTSAPARLSEYQSARRWVTEQGGDIFRTYAAFEWFVRKHRPEHIGSWQYFPRKGAAGALVGPQIEQVVIDILSRESCEGVVCNG